MIKKDFQYKTVTEQLDMSIKDNTIYLINEAHHKYYRSYSAESDKYERINLVLFLGSLFLGFSTSILIGIKEIFHFDSGVYNCIMIVLPAIVSLLTIWSEKMGYKKIEKVREEARIEAKFLVNEAIARFVLASKDEEFRQIHQWLNTELKKIQRYQSDDYFTS